jgi:hypothetical protein
MQLRHPGIELGVQVACDQMHVGHCGFNAAMAGEGRNLMNVPVRTRNIR